MSKDKTSVQFAILSKKLLKFTENSLNDSKNSPRSRLGFFNNKLKYSKSLQAQAEFLGSIGQEPPLEDQHDLLFQQIHMKLMTMKNATDKIAHLKGIIPTIERALEISVQIKKTDLVQIQSLKNELDAFKVSVEKTSTMPRYR